MKTVPIELKNYNRRTDRSVSFRTDSLKEMLSDDIAEVDSHIGDVGILVLTDSHNIDDLEEINIDDILEGLPENDLYDNHKTPSQRLRGVLFVILEQRLERKPNKEEFATFYKNQMEKIINKFKGKLE